MLNSGLKTDLANIPRKQSDLGSSNFAGSFVDKSISIEVLRSSANLKSEWQDLERRAYSTPFQRYSWIKLLYKRIEKDASGGVSDGRTPFIVTGRSNGRLEFILPLVLEKNILGKQLVWVDAGVSDYSGIVLDKDFAKQMPQNLFNELMSTIRKLEPNLDAVHLSGVPRSHDTFALLDVRTDSNWQAEHSSHTLKLSRSWKQLFEKVRSKKTRLRLRGKFRALKNTGNISFKQIRNEKQKFDATNQILQWKVDHLIKRGRRNPFGSHSQPSATRQAIIASVKADGSESIKVFGIYRGEELIAGMLAFVVNQDFYYLVSAYSPDVPGKYSIGTQLLVKTIELASRAGLKEYDFLLGDEAYKTYWCDSTVPITNHLTAYTWKGYVFRRFVRARHGIKLMIMNSPFLMEVARRFIRMSQGKLNPSLAADSALILEKLGADSFRKLRSGRVVSNRG